MSLSMKRAEMVQEPITTKILKRVSIRDDLILEQSFSF
jgi:hypothetical protein